jgi:hypothetical protein
MRSFIYRAHTWLGLIVAVPVLAWASSGLLGNADHGLVVIIKKEGAGSSS